MKTRIIAMFLVCAFLLVPMTACKGKDKKVMSSSQVTSKVNQELEDDSSSQTDSSSTTSSNTSNSASSAPANSIVTSIDTSAKSDDLYKDIKGTTVRVIAFAEPDTMGKLMIKEFEKKYGCTVKMEIYGWADWQVKILEMVGAGTPPDLAICFDQHFLKYVTSGVIQPVDSFIDAQAPFWDPNILNNYKWKGKTYSVATNQLDSIMLHYNKNLLENAGLDGSADPFELYKKGEWTFDKFREYAKKLTSVKDGKTDVWGYASWIHDAFIMAAGGKQIEVNTNGSIAITLDKPAEIAGLEMLRKLIHEDKSTSNAAMQGFNTLFNSQKVAFMAERPGYAVPDSSKKLSFEIGMVPFPKLNANSKYYTPAITQAWGVPVGAKNPKGAMAYIYYSAVFSEANRNTAFALAARRKVLTDEHLKIYQDATKANPKVFSFINGAGNWYNKQWPNLWKYIYDDNKTAVNAVASAKPVLQYEIDQMLKVK